MSDASVPPSSAPASPAVEVFCEYLRLVELEQEADFDAWCAARPELTEELRRLHEEYERVTLILERLAPAVSFSHRLRERYGRSVDLPNNPWQIAVVNETWSDGGGSHDEVDLYVAIARYGIEILRFLPDEDPGERLTSVGTARTPSGMGGLRIREDGQGDRTLLFAESLAGLRTFVYPQ